MSSMIIAFKGLLDVNLHTKTLQSDKLLFQGSVKSIKALKTESP